MKSAMFVRQPKAGELSEISELIDSEKSTVVVETVLPLSDTTRAQELSQTGHAREKIVLKVA